MAKREIIRYQLQSLEMQKGWLQPYFNAYGVSTHDTFEEAVVAKDKMIKLMNGRNRKFNGWSHVYKPSECYTIVEKKYTVDYEEPTPKVKLSLAVDMTIEDLYEVRGILEKRIKELEFENELKALIERANNNGISANTLLESITK